MICRGSYTHRHRPRLRGKQAPPLIFEMNLVTNQSAQNAQSVQCTRPHQSSKSSSFGHSPLLTPYRARILRSRLLPPHIHRASESFETVQANDTSHMVQDAEASCITSAWLADCGRLRQRAIRLVEIPLSAMWLEGFGVFQLSSAMRRRRAVCAYEALS